MNPEKTAILQEIQLSRVALARDLQVIRDEFNMAKKAEKVIRRNPLAWLAGASVGGFLLATWRRPAPKAKRTRSGRKGSDSAPPSGATIPAKVGLWGLLFGIFKLLFPLARPLLSAYASRRLAEMAMSLNSR